jgi:hypothetical protein
MYISEQISLEENITKIMELGICSTCNDVDSCVSRISNMKPVWNCEEFNNYVPLKDLSMLKIDSTRAGDIDVNSLMKGLCANCQLVENCVFPKAEGGVWHCNEYV